MADVLTTAALMNRHLKKLSLADQKQVIEFVARGIDQKIEAENSTPPIKEPASSPITQ